MITLYNRIFLKKIEINCHKTHYPSSKFFNFIRTFQKIVFVEFDKMFVKEFGFFIIIIIGFF